MVTLTSSARQDIHALAHQLSHAVGVEMKTALVPMSDSYQDYVSLYAVLFGSLLAACLLPELPPYPVECFFAFQVACFAVCSLVRPLRRALVWLVPLPIRRHRAARRAHEHYGLLSRHVPAGASFLLLYVSLAERYVHVLPSRDITAIVPDELWQDVISLFTSSVPTMGLRDATLQALQHIENILAAHRR